MRSFNSTIKPILFIVTLMCSFFSFGQSQGGENTCEDSKKRQLINDFFMFVNNYSQYCYGNKHESEAKRCKTAIFNLFEYNEGNPALLDFRHLKDTNLPKKNDQTTITIYLNELDILSKNDYLLFDYDEDSIKAQGEYMCVPIRVYYKKTGVGYTCMAKFYFKLKDSTVGCKINAIDYDSFQCYNKNNTIEPKPPHKKVDNPFLRLAAGGQILYDFTNHDDFTNHAMGTGPNVYVGLGGLSKNWFINRFRIGVEGAILFKGGYEKYPLYNDTPVMMKYETYKDNYALGGNMGYEFNKKWSVQLGSGCIWYDHWESSDDKGYSEAWYIKPTVRLSLPWPRLHLEAGGYFFRDESVKAWLFLQAGLNIINHVWNRQR